MKTIKVMRGGRPATQEELQCAVNGNPLPAPSSLAQAPRSASGRLLYVHDYFPPSREWRVFEALMLHAIGDEMLMVAVDEHGAMHVVKEHHHSKATSAAFFVYDDELHIAVADIEADWNRRHCWHLAYDDVQILKARMQNNQAEP